MNHNFKCPKCGGELTEWEDDWNGRGYRCDGHKKPEPYFDNSFSEYHWINRTKSCGFFEAEEIENANRNA